MIKIIVGHDYMDLDSLGSVALASLLYPDFIPLRSRVLHPLTRAVYSLYEKQLNFSVIKNIKDRNIDTLLVVDTQQKKRIKELFHAIGKKPQKIIVIDHHIGHECDLNPQKIVIHPYASNTTYLALQVKQKGIEVSAEFATVALLGIYADTGSFKHTNLTSADFEAASFLLLAGAKMSIIKHFLKFPIIHAIDNYLHMALANLKKSIIRGHQMTFFLLDIPYTSGISLITDQIFDIENVSTLFGCYAFEDRNEMLITARSDEGGINVAKVLKIYQGGGHAHSASVTIKNYYNLIFLDELMAHIENETEPGVRAQDIMCDELRVLEQDLSLYEASRYLENHHLDAVTIINTAGNFIGILTLGHISQARKYGRMKESILKHCNISAPFCFLQAPIYELEQIFFSLSLSYLPVLNTKYQPCGMITRHHYLEFFNKFF
ncbi:MAG: DHH family phosphoesterase [Spirochaetia bacterium]